MKNTKLDELTSMTSQMVSNIQKGLMQKREDQIIEALKNKGYEFSNRQEMIEFASTRCTEIHYSDDPLQKYLYVDGKEFICAYSNKIESNLDGYVFNVKIGA